MRFTQRTSITKWNFEFNVKNVDLEEEIFTFLSEMSTLASDRKMSFTPVQ
jgi:hypothetical protein